MTDADLYFRFALTTSITVGAAVCGLGFLIFAPSGWVGRTAIVTAGVGITTGLTAVLLPDLLPVVGGIAGVLGLMGVVFGTATVRRLAGRCLKPFTNLRVAGIAALIAAAAVWGFEAWWYDLRTQQRDDETLNIPLESGPPESVEYGKASTDCGTLIPVTRPSAPLSPEDARQAERGSREVRSRLDQIITREPASDDCNCHGWVFTGGRYILAGRYVDPILNENGYTQVDAPAPGDLCVYRDGKEQVTHTGIVRAALADGTILVESKWGRLGVYLHPVNATCYGDNATYYHTDRPGHELNGVEPVPSSEFDELMAEERANP